MEEELEPGGSKSGAEGGQEGDEGELGAFGGELLR